MNNELSSKEVVIPMWCCDAFENTVRGLDGDVSSHEQLSRLECFAEAVLTYDAVVVPRRYLQYEEISKTIGDDVFRPLREEELLHSWDLGDGITFTKSGFGKTEELGKENMHWNKQLNPQMHEMGTEQGWDSPEDFHIPILRLWQKESTLEAAAHHQADFIFPPSLRFNMKGKNSASFLSNGIDKMRAYTAAKIVDLEMVVRVDDLLANANDVPIFLALALSRSKDVSELPQALRSLRRDLGGLRKLKHSMRSEIIDGKTLAEMSKSMTVYRSALDSLLADKEVTSFWGRKVTVDEIASGIINAVTSPLETISKLLIPHYLKNKKEAKERRVLGGMVDLKAMIDKLHIAESYMKKMGIREIL